MAKRSHLSLGDIIRIPAGLFLMYLAGLAVYKAVATVALEPGRVIVSIFALIVAVIFGAIGFVMAFGWIGAGRKRRKTRTPAKTAGGVKEGREDSGD